MKLIDKLLGRQTAASSKPAAVAVSGADFGDSVAAKMAPQPSEAGKAPRRPEWMSSELRLPPWAKVSDTQYERANIHIEVDSEAAYAYWLNLLDSPTLDQYWLEVAHQCIKLDLQAALAFTQHDMRFADRHVAIKMTRAEKYAQAGKPVGKSATVKGRDSKDKTLRGADLASQGLEARGHYIRIRGALPA